MAAPSPDVTPERTGSFQRTGRSETPQGSGSASSSGGTSPAVVILAHDRPAQLHRLIASLDPLPVFLHVDANTPDGLAAEMTAPLPERVRLLPRRSAGWARVELLEAELDGYRAALRETDAEHVVLATGVDYPLVSAEELCRTLEQERGRSLALTFGLPSRNWGLLGGLDRFVVPQQPKGRSRRITGPPRRVPRGLRPTGGSQQKILARTHIARILECLDDDPRLWDFLATCWIPDEIAVPTLLASPRAGIDWAQEHRPGHPPWYIDWGEGRNQSPRWLAEADFAAVAEARVGGALFARKFNDDSAKLLDRIDRELRT